MRNVVWQKDEVTAMSNIAQTGHDGCVYCFSQRFRSLGNPGRFGAYGVCALTCLAAHFLLDNRLLNRVTRTYKQDWTNGGL
jgi:hypothetical protein